MVGHVSVGARVRRGITAAVLGALGLTNLAATTARADSTNFAPVVTASLGNDAARQASAFSVKITQKDGEEQIGPLSLSLPAAPNGYALDTNVTGTGAQIGTIHVVLYTDPRPSTLTIDGTLNDNNEGCSTSTKQCVRANLTVAPGVVVTADLFIYQDAGSYRISGDLTDTWNDGQVQGIHARLAELSATIQAKVGNDTVLRNPSTGGSYPLSYAMTSAAVTEHSSGGVYSVGGRTPACSPDDCIVPLHPKEYAPSAPGLQSPANGAAYLSTSPIGFAWGSSSDRNGDPITYTLSIDGNPAPTGTSPFLTTLAAGSHTWKVTAADDHGMSTSSAVRALEVVDPATALRFNSVINGDILYVDPVHHAFVYVAQGGTQYGGLASTASGPAGYIAFDGPFRLVVLYDADTTTAAGTLVAGSVRRPFLDPPG